MYRKRFCYTLHRYVSPLSSRPTFNAKPHKYESRGSVAIRSYS